VVDLDGAFGGVSKNLDILQKISKLGPKVQFGGGIRDTKLIDAALQAGASRIVIGTRAATDSDFLKQIASDMRQTIDPLGKGEQVRSVGFFVYFVNVYCHEPLRHFSIARLSSGP
jgi:phosphoribosylformimino-5-aminoimidazole carboxamide ribotide isomerase